MKNSLAIFIPARGGSKRIPKKNLVLLDGKPLIHYAISVGLKITDNVYVSTDNEDIATVALKEGATVVKRPSALCTDDATTELAMLHFIKSHSQYNEILLLECTSPFITCNDLKHLIEVYEKKPNISAILLARHLLWQVAFTPDYKYTVIPERKQSQDYKFQDYTYSEAGAWITPVDCLLKGSRTTDHNSYYVMPHENIDIDNIINLKMAEVLMNEK